MSEVLSLLSVTGGFKEYDPMEERIIIKNLQSSSNVQLCVLLHNDLFYPKNMTTSWVADAHIISKKAQMFGSIFNSKY